MRHLYERINAAINAEIDGQHHAADRRVLTNLRQSAQVRLELWSDACRRRDRLTRELEQGNGYNRERRLHELWSVRAECEEREEKLRGAFRELEEFQATL